MVALRLPSKGVGARSLQFVCLMQMALLLWKTFANMPDGFVKLISFIVQVAMGPSVRLVFTLCQHRVNDSLTMHQAAV